MSRASKLLTLATLALASAAVSTETIAYKHDARGRLVWVMLSGGPLAGTQVNYTHDAAGNRTMVQATGATPLMT